MALSSALIVDARADRREYLRVLLQHRILRVGCCDEGYAALSGMLREAPDLLLLDCLLPGWGAAGVLQGMDRFVLRPLVVLLPGGQPVARDMLRNPLVVGALDEPIRVAELEHLLFGHTAAEGLC